MVITHEGDDVVFVRDTDLQPSKAAGGDELLEPDDLLSNQGDAE